MIESIEGGVRIYLYVQPNGRKSEILGVHDGALKIRIQAPPVEGKANAAIEEFIAEILKVSKSKVSLIRGAQSRLKVVEVKGVSPIEVTRRLGISE